MALRSGPGEPRETLEVMIYITPLARDDGEAAEGVAHLELVAHAHAAVQLHRFLAHLARGVADLDLRGRHDSSALVRIDVPIHAGACEARHGARLLALDHHVDHAVLQRLERADR